MSVNLKRQRSSSAPAEEKSEQVQASGKRQPAHGSSRAANDAARNQNRADEADRAQTRIHRRRSIRPGPTAGSDAAPSASVRSITSRDRRLVRATGVPRALSHSPDEAVQDDTDEAKADGGHSNADAQSVREEPRHATEAESDETMQQQNTFELEMVQQPEVGAEAGTDTISVGRLPVVPAPVVRLRVRNSNGDEIDDGETPYMFCSCSLKTEQSRSGSRDLVATDNEAQSEFSALIGNTVRTSHQVTDLDGAAVSYFVFDDVSVRTTGTYRLEFTLAEAKRPKSPKLAATLSEPFEVVPRQQYPGRPAASILTPLSRHLHRQGVPMYVPPLVLDPGPPPTAGSNPFPPEQLRELTQNRSRGSG
ncbi:hypothetical protein ACM66B_001898 [Microbotryomycetes sp. NB124-2]